MKSIDYNFNISLKFFILLLLINFNNQINSIIFFNPIIDNNGVPYCYKNCNIDGAIAGWIDILPHNNFIRNKKTLIKFDRILALKYFENNKEAYRFILPSDPDLIIPAGLYCWQSAWKRHVDKHDIIYLGVHRDLCIINKFLEESKPNMAISSTPCSFGYHYNYQSCKWEYYDPKHATTAFYQENNNKNKDLINNLLNQDLCANYTDNKLIIRQEFYKVMGVTETYMREFLGSEPDQFELPLEKRTPMRMTNLPCRKFPDFFPPILETKYLNRNIINLAGKFELLDQSNLIIILDKQIKAGKVILIDKNYLPHHPSTSSGCAGLKFRDFSETQLSFMRYLQTQPEFNDAVFSVFTDFNGLENCLGDYRVLIEDLDLNLLETNMANLITRKYYLRSIDFLEKLEDYSEIKNGNIVKIVKKFKPEDYKKIKFAYFSDVKINNTNKVNYIFNGVINLRNYNCLNNNSEIYLEIPNEFLKIAIKNSINIAKFKNKKKIVFNLDSLGYFGYSPKFIEDFFNSEYISKLFKNSGLEIYLLKNSCLN